MRTLNIIGAGKLGRTLAHLWARRAVFAVQDVLCARAASALAAVEFIGGSRAAAALGDMRYADVWLLTPPDSRIIECCAALAASGILRAGDIVLQCSGSQPACELAAAEHIGAHVASVHPVTSVAEPARAAQTFAGTWCGAEGNAAALAVLRPAFEAIGARMFDIDPGAKMVYHAASVIACNYLVALVETSARCFEKAGLERHTALQVMEPLVRETVANVFRLGTVPALTGPIARGDPAVIARQVEALAAWDPRIAAIYKQLGVIVLELARKQEKASADALAAIERTLSGDG